MKPPSLILWQRKIGESRNSNPYGRCEGKKRRGGRGKTPALQANTDVTFLFKNRWARERSECWRASAERENEEHNTPLQSWSVNPTQFLLSYERSTISKEEIEGCDMLCLSVITPPNITIYIAYNTVNVEPLYTWKILFLTRTQEGRTFPKEFRPVEGRWKLDESLSNIASGDLAQMIRMMLDENSQHVEPDLLSSVYIQHRPTRHSNGSNMLLDPTMVD